MYLPRANFRGWDLRFVDWGWSDLSHADFSRANTHGMKLSSANITGAIFTTPDIRKFSTRYAEWEPYKGGGRDWSEHYDYFNYRPHAITIPEFSSRCIRVDTSVQLSWRVEELYGTIIDGRLIIHQGHGRYNWGNHNATCYVPQVDLRVVEWDTLVRHSRD